jgi:hypothetical protein
MVTVSICDDSVIPGWIVFTPGLERIEIRL